MQPVYTEMLLSTAEKILVELIGSKPRPVNFLAEHFGYSQARILAAIDLLKSSGCLMDIGPAGISLRQVHWSLWRNALESRSRQHGLTLGRNVLVFASTGSTNDVCRQATRQVVRPETESLVVLADQQSAGRGRRGNRWQAKAGQALLLSVLFPSDQNLNPETTTLCAAIAVARCIEQLTGRSTSLKWPNDLLIEGRKLAGILVETMPTTASPGAVASKHPLIILGIGVNVTQSLEDFSPEIRSSATSISYATDREFDRLTLAAALLEHIENICLKPLSSVCIAAEWKQRCNLLNRVVRLTHGGAMLEGRVVDIDPSLGLVITDAHARTHFVSAAATNLVEI